ncbi:MAG: ATP-binding protein [Bryobacteraceae bacterium]|nr:ATP-binding protein [Bryobacteraceae bacterium]
MARTRYNHFDKSPAADAASPCRLWLLRLLVPLGGQRVFVRKESFESDFLAEALGLEHWINPVGNDFNPRTVRAELRRLHTDAEERAQEAKLPRILARNLDRLARLVDLNDVDRQILTFAAYLKTDRLLDDVTDWLGALSSGKLHKVLAVLLDLPEVTVRAALSMNGALTSAGLLSVDRRGNFSLNAKLELLNDRLADHLMSCDDDNLSALFREAVAPSPAPNLEIGDFEHVGRALEILQPYLKCSLDIRRRGVNVFLYGAPGTGKTQLARVLAGALDCETLEVSGENDDGDCVSGERRLRAYRFAQSFFARRRALLIFDEVEDVFNDGDNFFGRKSIAQTRKAWINRTLEENPVPTLWLSNSISCLDPAFVRRFDMVVELPVPSRSYRRRIIGKSCGNLLTAESMARIAECESLAPAVVTRAASLIECIADKLPADRIRNAIEYLIDNTLIAQGHPPLAKAGAASLPDTYDPDFIHADADLAMIAEGIGRSRSARLCLYGPPGTGKSAYGRWLADHLGLALHQRRVSDLVSKWVGDTEKNLARAFRDAEREGALLLLDEVDSFLRDRRSAQRSWEVTEVNEMLTQMESYNGVLVATTNLVDDLDQAALRRFDLKVKFHHLRPEQAWSLLARHCAARSLPAPDVGLRSKLSSLHLLTPGDFAAVARQHRFRPVASAAELVEALQAECQIKEGAHRSTIGFL